METFNAMDVFILGGSRQQYLEFQVQQIRENVIDLGDIIWVTGPLSLMPRLASSSTHVPPKVAGLVHLPLPASVIDPGLKHTRVHMLHRVILANYAKDYALILHGDTIPVGACSKEILLDGKLCAWNRCIGAQWRLSNQMMGGEFLEMNPEVVKSWPLDPITIEGFRFGLCAPCFLHLDDLSVDPLNVIERKLEVAKRWVNVTDAKPNLSS